MTKRDQNCHQHGPFVSENFFGTLWSKCPKCEDVDRIEKAKAEAIRIEANHLRRAHARLIGAGITPRFMDATLESYSAEGPKQIAALEKARAYVDGFDSVLATGRSMMFVGTPGTGKTHLAVGIVRALLDRGNHSCLITTVMRLLRRVKETWGASIVETEREAVSVFVKPDLLVLDEVGVQFGSNTERNILFDVINERYEHLRPTILLSNLTHTEVSDFLGERVIDRLRENGGQYVVFDWPSWRKRVV